MDEKNLQPKTINASTATQNQTNRVALIVVSKHHGNTMKIAQAIAYELRADIFSPDEVKGNMLEDFSLVGFGSGIYYGRHDAELLNLVKTLAHLPPKAFVFSTSGNSLLSKFYRVPLRRRLLRRGCQVIGEFNCPGWDTFGPFGWFGGISKERPSYKDTVAAMKFARELLVNISHV